MNIIPGVPNEIDMQDRYCPPTSKMSPYDPLYLQFLDNERDRVRRGVPRVRPDINLPPPDDYSTPPPEQRQFSPRPRSDAGGMFMPASSPPNALMGGIRAGGRNSLMDDSAEHPVISAARRAGADVDSLLQARDLNGLLDAAVRGNPQLGTDHGSMVLDGFAQSFKRSFNLTGRELPDARPPGNMPNALFGPTGLPRPLPRPQGYE